jgi:hypothetical protein
MAELPLLPLPKGMTVEQINAIRVNEGKWRPLEGYVCRTCGGQALGHPYTPAIWGCMGCGTTTASPFIYFKEVANLH